MKSESKFSGIKKLNTESVAVVSWWPVQLGLLLAAAAVSGSGFDIPAMILFGAAIFGAVCRIWSVLSCRNLSVRVDTPKTGIFPENEAIVKITVKNDKFLPVPWIDGEMILEKPAAMDPGEKLLGRDGEKFNVRCCRIGSHSHSSFDTQWTAVRRGIINLRKINFFTGDGFGFVKAAVQPDLSGTREIAVYPKLVHVDIESFIRNMWEGENSPKGILEDVSLIKLTRPYEEHDSLKKINWRMLARGQELTAKQYEVIRPRKIHFIFDGESFNGREPHEDELEETLSILASLLMRLDEWGMECGFSFPATRRLRASDIFPGGDTSREILYRMAEYQMIQPEYKAEASNTDERIFYAPSYFNEENIVTGWQQLGKVWFVTFDRDSAAESRMLKKLRGFPVNVLTFEELTRLKGGCHAG